MIFLFHSWDFILFFLALLGLYWALPQRFRNPLLLFGSYLFYASWDWRFLGLLWVSTLVDYFCGARIARSEGRTRKAYLGLSLGVNLGLLCFFKYFNFFLESFVALVSGFGYRPPVAPLTILLPLGISFYTFQTLSYSIDIYRDKLTPTKSLLNFALFVSYFPQLIAGPIEKARDLLPQIEGPKQWAQVPLKTAFYLFVYGAFKKVVIADSMAVLVERVFADPSADGGQVVLAIYAFGLQLYCDFSGYSKMARGLSLMLGVKLSTNFNLPFFSENYFDFYRRWHITLCDWISEYVYTPLFYYLPSRTSISRVKNLKTRLFLGATLSLFVTRMLFAIWHGAKATFVVLGLYIFAIQLLTVAVRPLWKANWVRRFDQGPLRALTRCLQVVLMFQIYSYGVLLFRAEDLWQVSQFTVALGQGFSLSAVTDPSLWALGLLALFLLFYEWLQYRQGDQLFLSKKGLDAQLVFYLILFAMAVHIGARGDQRFIYFQY